MKRIIFTLFSFMTLTGFSQVQDTLYVYKNGALYSKIGVNGIDSITFTPPAKVYNGIPGNYVYKLMDYDYATISLAALKVAANAVDSAAAKSIAVNKLFADTISANKYIPMLLPARFSYAAEKSSALISYNFYAPLDTTKIIPVNKYTLIMADYDAMGTGTSQPGQYDDFSVSIDPFFYIPIWLKINNPFAKAGDAKLIRYRYYISPANTQQFSVFVFNGTSWEVYNTSKQTTENFKLINNRWQNTTIFSERFQKDFGSFKPIIVTGTYTWMWFYYNGGSIQGNGYGKGAVETWLVSPVIDLTDRVSPALSFDHAVNFADGLSVTDLTGVYVSTDYTTEVTKATWQKLTFNYPTTYSWTFLSSGKIDLSAYVNKKITVGFKYVSDTASCLGWEFTNIKITDQ